ncbi:PAS domain S-box protein [Anabaena sp. UHCC 0451]|uniref:PAS domain S-box protein n=1 Tax=Anabaena sp. UHCC 0451 TaxID=2055235 RepID=UPI002B1F27CA|nr:PAS domain S-box protein [Anabaena sp. UHCC 0451]MEA5575603.1 PAS domain S-box protein [Anabaena sp. UHCC 0451]
MQLNEQVVSLTNLHQVINRYPLTISRDSHLIDATILMNQGKSNKAFSKDSQKSSSYVLVVEEEKLLGILTLRDILRLTSLSIDFSKTKISEVMTQQLITLKQSDFQDISKVLSILQQQRIHHLPIIDDEGKLLGLITESEILQELDIVRIAGVVDSIQQIRELGTENNDLLERLVDEKITQEIKIKEKLQQTIEELQIVEEEIRQQNEQLLIANEITELERRRYQNLFEFTPCGYLVTDNDGIIQEANHTASSLLSINQKHLLGKPIRIFIAQSERCNFINRLANLQQFQEWEVSLQPRRKKPFPANMKIAAMYDSQGQQSGWSWLLSDISERKQSETAVRLATEELEKIVAERTSELVVANQALQQEIKERKETEAALRKSEGIFRQFGDNIPTLVIWISCYKTGKTLYINPAYEKIWGRSCQSLWENPQSWIESIHPEDRILTEARQNLPNTEASNVKYRIVRPDGSIRWMLVRCFPITNEQGEIQYFSGIAEDITEQKQKEQQIYEQAALLDIATDAIFVRDFQTEILFWSQGAERIYGWEKDEAVGKNLKDIFSSETTSQAEATALKTVVKSGTWQGELHKLTKFGQKILVQSRWTLMFDDDGQPKSILIVDTDITEKKQLEEQFLRTQRLESLGTLASGMAHDLNNILTPILVASQLIKGRCAKDKERHPHLLSMIEINAKRGAALVKQVLSFGRGFKGERTIVQVKHLLTEIIQIGQQTFTKSIEFSIHIQENLGTICGDSTQIHQVLMNLVVNARDAMPVGGLLTISAENRFIDETYTRMNLDAKVGHYIVITITDTGMGMSSDILDRIFEPFFTTKEVGVGTGLGLSTALGIVKSHYGFVTVSSQVGKGSTFQVFLPSLESPQPPDVEQLEIAPGKKELILIVDDEPQIRDLAKIILENNNYQTLTASNGLEAISLYAQHKQQISVVLMDMMMPEMDGITAIYSLQKINPQVQIIACSGLGTIELLPESSETKVQAVLLKPYTANELLQNLNQVIGNSYII